MITALIKYASVIFISITRGFGMLNYGLAYLLRFQASWVVLIVSSTITIYLSIASALDTLLGYMDQSQSLVASAHVVSSVNFLYILEVCNYVLPIEESFAFLILLSSLWLQMLLYKFIKSWIPLV